MFLRARHSSTISRKCGFMVGSPPERLITSTWPSEATSPSRILPTSTGVRCRLAGFFTRQIGQARSQWSVISMMGVQMCCSCSGHMPQECGQPAVKAVWKLCGTEPAVKKARASR